MGALYNPAEAAPDAKGDGDEFDIPAEH